jgi:dipeptidyl aminopeptidase/acylaminoacyl peptidase
MSRRFCAAIAAASAVLCLFLPVTAVAGDPAPRPAAQAGPPPISDFVRPTDFWQVSLSPDGKYIAAVVPSSDNPHENVLAILDGRTAHMLKAIPAGRGALIHEYFWTDDDRLVASLAVQIHGEDTPKLTGALFAIDPDGSHQLELFGIGSGATGSLIRSEGQRAAAYPITHGSVDKDEILIEVHDYTAFSGGSVTKIDRLNVRNGRTAQIGAAPARNARMLADHAGQVRVAFAENSFTHSDLWLRKDNQSPWVLVNESRTSGAYLVPVAFNRDNSKLYVRVSSSSGPDSIELMDMDTRQRTRLYQGQFADPGILLATADKKDFYAVQTEEGRPGLHYFNEDSDEAQLSQAMAKNFPGQYSQLIDFTRDGKRAVVFVRSDRNPGDFYLFDLDTRNAQLLAHARPWVVPDKMRPMDPVDIAARDGVNLRGFLTLPAGSKPYPLVVLPHGGPHGIHDVWGFNTEAQLLASRGYAVLQVNYRGSGGYGSQFQQMGYRHWGLSMQDDLTDATQWAIHQGYADAQRICIYGTSYGGYAALEGAVREPDLYKCAVGYAGVYDLRVQMDSSDTQRSDAGTSYLDLVLGTDRDDLLRRSPLSGVSRIKADLLLIHGEDDRRVPYKNFQEFTSALDKDGKHYETLVEPLEGHGFFVPAHREAAYQKLLDFLGRNIGPGNNGASNVASTKASATP